MNIIDEYLALAISAAESAVGLLNGSENKYLREHSYQNDSHCEIKARADKILEELIFEHLMPTGLSILSEEKGELHGKKNSPLRFIVDPLDGTMNFVRNLGMSSISIALYSKNTPLFGVLALYPSGDIVWGGKSFGSFLNDNPINVSSICKVDYSVLCTGFPSRFNFKDIDSAKDFYKIVSDFGKIRMLGSASISLFKVATGSAEMYTEKEIMLWDVAAGLAIVEGAGGVISVSTGLNKGSLNVVATNKCKEFISYHEK